MVTEEERGTPLASQWEESVTHCPPYMQPVGKAKNGCEPVVSSLTLHVFSVENLNLKYIYSCQTKVEEQETAIFPSELCYTPLHKQTAKTQTEEQTSGSLLK